MEDEDGSDSSEIRVEDWEYLPNSPNDDAKRKSWKKIIVVALIITALILSVILGSFPLQQISTTPSSPSRLHVATGDGFVFLSWTLVYISGQAPVTSYNVFRGIDNHNLTFFFSMDYEYQNQFSDHFVETETTYRYQVSAINRFGEGPRSPIANVTYHSLGEPTGWNRSVIDDSTLFGEYNSIAVDSNDEVHISYYDSFWQPGGGLKYATNKGGNWTTTRVPTYPSSGGRIGLHTSIATDSKDNLHISYFDFDSCTLRYATNVGGNWSNYTIDRNYFVGTYSSIGIDSKDCIHISYYDTTQADLKYATNSYGNWTNATIDSNGEVGASTSLAIDSLDRIHIAYYDRTNQAVKYTIGDGDIWSYTFIDTVGGEYETIDSSSISLDVDSSSFVHIAYYDWTDICLKYATNAGGAWHSTVVRNLMGVA